MTPDRELRCVSCVFRMFTSRAPELVQDGQSCPVCGADMELGPEPRPMPEFAYPAVIELRRRIVH